VPAHESRVPESLLRPAEAGPTLDTNWKLRCHSCTAVSGTARRVVQEGAE
jgi:hypothetical protein